MIRADELSSAINNILNEYSKETTENVKKAVKEVAEECKSEIQLNSPIATGKYKRGWRATQILDSPFNTVYQIHNKTNYQLVHLLEFGHDKWIFGTHIDGQRVRPIPHVRPAEAKAENDLMKKIKESI